MYSTYMYTVSEKFTPLAYYDFDIHEQILMTLGRNLAEKVNHQKMFYFPTSPNWLIRIFLKIGNRRSTCALFVQSSDIRSVIVILTVLIQYKERG